MDKRTVFADGLDPRARAEGARSRRARRRAAERLADARHQRRPAHGHEGAGDRPCTAGVKRSVEQNANGFHWALDNWMHTADSDIFLRLKNGKFEVQKTLSRGEWGVTQDDAGRIYRNTNESALHVDFVPTPYFARNPNLLRTRGSYERAAGRRQRGQHRLAGAPESRHQPRLSDRHRSPGRHAGAVHGGLRAARVPRRPAAGGAVRQRLRRRAGRQPGEPHHPERRRHDAAGAEGVRARASSSRPPTSASVPSICPTPPTARCTSSTCIAASSSTAPTSPSTCAITSSARKLEQPTGLGRIYRVVHETTRRDTDAALSTRLAGAAGRGALASERLVARHRAAAARRARQTSPIVAGARDSWPARADGLADAAARAVDARRDRRASTAATVTKALEDPSRDVRVSAIRIAERWLGDAGHPIQAAVLKRLDDRGLGGAAATGRLARRAAAGPARSGAGRAARTARRRSDRDGCRAERAARQRSRGAREADAQRAAQTPQREAAITMLAATIVRGGRTRPCRACSAAVAADSRPLVAAVGAAARRRGRAARGGGSRQPRRGRDGGAAAAEALSDLSGRPGRPGRSVRVSADAEARPQPARTRREEAVPPRQRAVAAGGAACGRCVSTASPPGCRSLPGQGRN